MLLYSINYKFFCDIFSTIFMDQINYSQILSSKRQTIALIVFVVMILVLALSFVQPLQYRSRVEFLIIQQQSLTMDAYAAARASEKLASILATIVRTKFFFNKVINGNFGISRSDFPSNEKALRKYWEKNTRAVISPETSLLQVNVYNKNKEVANKIALAIAVVLGNEAGKYYGDGNKIIMVNEPLVSKYPVRPNIVANGLIGLIVGLALSVGWIIYAIYQEDRKINYNKVGASNLIAEDNSAREDNSVDENKRMEVFRQQLWQ